MKKVILITGASSGFGLASANALQADGHIVYGASRSIKELKNISFIPLEMDVTDDASVNSGVEQIIKEQGKIDVLINNAGIVTAGPAYSTPVEFAKKQFEVNFFGVVRLSTAVLPGMIEQKKGLVINMSSMAGLFGLAYQSKYVAAKFALEGYSQSLRMELQNTGVDVVVVNPGDFKTANTSTRDKMKFPFKHPKLEAEYAAAIDVQEENEINGGDPAVVGKLIAKIVSSSKPAHRYLAGDFGQTRLPLIVKALLPSTMFSKMINGYYNIK
ncbi:NADP-dependent 3-hydroxy acid dehydrogenase YdfG [Pedobacter westerhofensis]|uniref:NADP-dependent 3-hydroxy acid dehydrogenase YdfG n=1 Tax=Pedobacter westerhofensis TaxID=425512 RepID=A0A521CDH3_9SPHI|nr:SDR family oxidoreductase [Pedobacter westerhofensis]SMO57463.1 NADP-dependent 3-hydroxy acid dehydrogenase YdfG [Pedobacter westerhofensis]